MKIGLVGKHWIDDSGQAQALLYKVTGIEGMTPEDIMGHFPSERCTHAHDCCGNWYPNQGVVVRIDLIYDYALVSQHCHLNV